jgi:hypothetical protein
VIHTPDLSNSWIDTYARLIKQLGYLVIHTPDLSNSWDTW